VRSPLVPLIIGIAFLSGAVYAGAERRRTHEADVRDILALRRELDSTRAALHRAASVADSVRLAKSAENREYILRRREFHVAPRAEAIALWWSPTGPGTLLAAIGAMLVLAAYFSRRHPVG
jgi:hypothetical protein